MAVIDRLNVNQTPAFLKDGVFDISEYNNGAVYTDLSDALGRNSINIPPTIRKGGMSVKFIMNDNKYVKYMLTSDTFTTNELEWKKQANISSFDSVFDKMLSIVWDGGTSTRKVFYDQNGNKINVDLALGGFYGTAKIPCAEYIGRKIGINVVCTHAGSDIVKCLFIKADNVVIEYWNQNEYTEKVIPEDAAYLLLSNSFANPDETPVCQNPFVVGMPNFDDVNELKSIIETKTSIESTSKLAEKTCIYLTMPWMGGGIDYSFEYGKQYIYAEDGTLTQIGSSLPSKFGVLSIDVSSYRGKLLLIKDYSGNGSFNLLVDSNNNVIEKWNSLNELRLVEIPQNASRLLLSNAFGDNYCPNPIVGLLYSSEQITELQKHFLVELPIAVQDGYCFDNTRVRTSNSNFNCVEVNVAEYAGKIVEISCDTFISTAFNFLLDSNSQNIGMWQMSGNNKTQMMLLPSNATTLLLSNYKAALEQPSIKVLDDSYLVEEFKDLYSYVHNNVVNIEDYERGTESIEEKYVPCIYENKEVSPTISSGYQESLISNPIDEVNIDKIPTYRKTGGSTIYPIKVEYREFGKATGLWVNPDNYTNTLRIQCGATDANNSQRAFYYKDIELDEVFVGFETSATSYNLTIIVKCLAISQSGYIYFSVNVNSADASDVYYNIIPYETGGSVQNVDYDILVIQDASDPYLKPYKVKIADIIQRDNIYEKLCLPEQFIFEKGKTYMLFKHSMFMGINYRNYNIQVFVTDTTSTEPQEQLWCKDYDRYIQYTPLLAGDVNARIVLFDNNRNILDEKEVVFKTIERTTQPSTLKTLLFVGDSLTFYNRITDEFYRVLTSNDTASTTQDTISIYSVKKPAGRNWANITLIGTQKNNYLGWIGQTYHEGRSGWQWANFITSGSPFYYNGALDFAHYLSANNFNTPDIVYIGLGWNDTKAVVVSDNGKIMDVSAVMNNAKTFLDAITTQWPNAKIRLWTQNITGTRGGAGNHPYGAVEWADEQRMNLMQFAIMTGYKALVQNYQNVELVWSTAFIDTEYSLQEENADINTRIADKEVRGKDYVHPADSGFFEIADAIIADFCSLI